MKSSRILAGTTLALILLVVAASNATAGSLGNGAAQRQKLEVEAVDPVAGTIELKSGVDQSVETFKVDAKTRIAMVGKKATLDEIKPGMKVVNCSPGFSPAASGTQTLIMIMVWTAPAAPTPNP